jgi:hypothetical protein
MKRIKISILAVLVASAGLGSAAAQGTGPYYNVGAMEYPLHERLISQQRFAYTAGLPALTSIDLESLSGAVATDGSGRIAGLVYARIYFGGLTNRVTDYGAFTITVTGKISNRGTNPLVKVTMNGKGYDFDGLSNHPNASLNLKFVSTNKLVDVPATQSATITNANYIVTFADGTTQAFTDGPATRTNSAFTFLSGTIRGNIKPGKKSPVNDGKQITVKENGALVTEGSVWAVVNGTNFIEQRLSGGLVLDNFTNIDAQVIQPVPGSRLFLNAYVGSTTNLLSGNGSANTNSGNWNAGFTGIAFARGLRMQANGTLGPLIIAYDPIPGTTNFLPRVVLNAIQDITINSGNIFGQKVLKTQGFSVPAPPPDP